MTLSHTRNDIAWKKQMKKVNAHGIQIREDEKPYFCDIMQVRGYPKFMFYSPEGKLISKDAPRYSSGKRIRYFLNKYLKIQQ